MCYNFPWDIKALYFESLFSTYKQRLFRGTVRRLKNMAVFADFLLEVQ